MSDANFPDNESLQSIRELWIGGHGFEISRFLYQKDRDNHCSVEITWRNTQTREEVTYRFRGVVPHALWPVEHGVVDVDNARLRQWDTPRPLRITFGEMDVMFYASSIERFEG